MDTQPDRAFIQASNMMHADTEWAMTQVFDANEKEIERLKDENARLRERVRHLEDKLLLIGWEYV